jgi:hypothetical protein
MTKINKTKMRSKARELPLEDLLHNLAASSKDNAICKLGNLIGVRTDLGERIKANDAIVDVVTEEIERRLHDIRMLAHQLENLTDGHFAGQLDAIRDAASELSYEAVAALNGAQKNDKQT